MAHDVFISYSNMDKPIADAICAHLEGRGIRCWIAPRDILPGEDWPSAITNAISQSRVMVLVFSASSNSSDDVSRELMLAANHKLVIVPFKIENIEPEPGKQYYLARTHWLDAVNPPTREQIDLLCKTVKVFVENAVGGVEARVVLDDHTVSQIASSTVPMQAQPPKEMKKPDKKWVIWIYILVPVVLIAVVIGSRLFIRPAASTVKPTATNTTIPRQTNAAPTVEPSATNTTIPSQTNAAPTVDATATKTIISRQLTIVTVSDPFDDNKYKWPVMQQWPDGETLQDMQVQNGELDWNIDCAVIDGCFYSQMPIGIRVVSDFDLFMDVKHTQESVIGYGGIIFRFVDIYNYYGFAYRDDDRTFLIWKVVKNSWSDVAAWKESTFINSYQFNRLRVEAFGSSFNFYINGNKVYSAEITGISAGKVGVTGGTFTPGMYSQVYDNFELSGTTTK
jgi:hypothetical protein